MSSIFKKYATYYDLYYQSKDYQKEAEFILSLAADHAPPPNTLLDMGCGTGRHMNEFCQSGLNCDGFDQSLDMIESAKKRYPKLNIVQGNLTSFRNSKKYDLVVSLFAVMGYLVSNKDLIAGFRTASEHLKSGGLFIFDSWFGPAVLNEKPEERTHIYQDQDQLITRKAVPQLDILNHKVTVNYNLNVKGKDESSFSESHSMRFFFIPEILMVAAQTDFKLIQCCPFLKKNQQMTENDWNSCFVLKKL